MFSQLGVPATGGAINGQRSPDSGQTTASLPIGLANVLHEARQHAANFDGDVRRNRQGCALQLPAERINSPHQSVMRSLSDRWQVTAVG
jgi:hypothetical protein